MGVDERGREVLEFVPDAVPWPGHVHLMEPDGTVLTVGRMIRDFHDAVEGFVPPANAEWRTLIPADGAEIIAHHDLAPWNLVVGDRRWAFIDWDAAAPGTRLWDLAYAAHGFTPLSPRVPVSRAARRLRLLADAYGLDEPQRRELLGLLGARTRSMYDFLAAQASAGTQPWSRLWDDGHGVIWRADADHIDQNRPHWEHALPG